jgi:hypothetical protein
MMMGNSHLYSHPWWRATVVRLIRETCGTTVVDSGLPEDA